MGQLSAHLNRAMDNGLTKSEASETLTHLLFYGAMSGYNYESFGSAISMPGFLVGRHDRDEGAGF